MQTTMALSALVMGLVGGPHCIAMCGAACAGIASASGGGGTAISLVRFQFSRMIGYAAMGAMAAGSVQGLAWFSANTVVLRPVWTMMHVAALMMGAVLLFSARQPAWVDGLSQRVWKKVKPMILSMGKKASIILGIGWALMPCGLLYSALLVASLSADMMDGAIVMASFSIGTSIALTLGPWLFLRINKGRSGEWGIRMAGFALMGTSGWALWMGITEPSGLWCM